MMQEELKEKIIEAYKNVPIETVMIENVADVQPVLIKRPIPDLLADALIAAGLRFGENLTVTFDHMALEREHELERRLTEAEHRAEVAERALKSRALCHVLQYLSCEPDILKSFIQELYEAWIYQAEKELAEERKD